ATRLTVTLPRSAAETRTRLTVILPRSAAGSAGLPPRTLTGRPACCSRTSEPPRSVCAPRAPRVTLLPPTTPAKEDRPVALHRLDDRGFCPTLLDEASAAAGCPVAVAVAARTETVAKSRQFLV